MRPFLTYAIELTSKMKAFSEIQKIHKGFQDLAQYYDRFNDFITFGLHRLWKKKLLKYSNLEKQGKGVVADLCCGSGDIAFLFAQYLGKKAKIVAIDFSHEMLSILKKTPRKISI